MTKRQLENIFRDMLLLYRKAAYYKDDHWKIPNESYIIRIVLIPRSPHVVKGVNISIYKGEPSTLFSIDDALEYIRFIISTQLDLVKLPYRDRELVVKIWRLQNHFKNHNA